jgi:hypothetical protein
LRHFVCKASKLKNIFISLVAYSPAQTPVLKVKINLESAANKFLSIGVRNILKYKTFAFATLILWLLVSWSGAHGHMCFDGQEPPVTVHMEILTDHPEHDSSENHVDANVELSQLLIVKLHKIDLPLLTTALLLLNLFFKTSATPVSFFPRAFISSIVGLRPPLRAPPVFPA